MPKKPKIPEPGKTPKEEFEQEPMGGVHLASVELAHAQKPKISSNKYHDAIGILTRYAQTPTDEYRDEQPHARTRRFHGLLEGSDPSGVARYIDETITAYPGGGLIHARGVRSADSDPENDVLNSKDDVGCYHVALGLDIYKRAVIVNTTKRKTLNRILGEILKEVRSGWEAPVDTLYRLVEEAYKGKNARGSERPFLEWARTHSPIERIEDNDINRIL